VAAYAPSLTKEDLQEIDRQEYLQSIQSESLTVSAENVIESTQTDKENVIKQKEPKIEWINVKVSAYDLSVQSCGKRKTHKEYGISRSGVSLKGHTRESAMAVAVDPKMIPLGNTIQIEFYDEAYQKYNGIYNCVDTGRLIKGNKIDLFMGDFGDNNSKEAMRFGIAEAKIIIIKNEEENFKMEKKDIVIVCSDCSTEFLFTVGEQIFYEEHEFVEPKRCRECRKARKVINNQKN
jgi:3D (Asp-Asp-Asp) domain-containing protein